MDDAGKQVISKAKNNKSTQTELFIVVDEQLRTIN